MFELQIKLAPPGLAPLGRLVELRELSYGDMREAMASAGGPARASDGLLAASLHVDGAPIGLAGLLALPGRFMTAINQATEAVAEMHGLATGSEPEPAPMPANDDPEKKA